MLCIGRFRPTVVVVLLTTRPPQAGPRRGNEAVRGPFFLLGDGDVDSRCPERHFVHCLLTLRVKSQGEPSFRVRGRVHVNPRFRTRANPTPAPTLLHPSPCTPR